MVGDGEFPGERPAFGGGSTNDPDYSELLAMTGRFAGLVDDWTPSGVELDDLLCVGPGDGLRIVEAGLVPGPEAETRMRRSLELNALARSMLGGIDELRTWLRRSNPGIVGGATPLAVVCDRAGGLRAMRDALRREAFEAANGVGW